MKFEKVKQFKTIGTAVSLALLLGMGSVNAAGNGKGKSNSPNNGDTFGASIGVSSTCALDDTKTVFEVTTTITDKSSGDTIPSYGPDMSYVDYIGKKSGRKTLDSPYVISDGNLFAPAPVVVNTLDLCAARAGDHPSLKDGTVSLNSLTSVYVSNSKGGTSYTAQCSDNPDTIENEGKVVIDLGLLDLACQ